MANIETWFEQDLMNPVTVRNVGSIFSQDSLGNLIGVRVKKNGDDFTLSGSVNGYCILADGSTVPVIGTRSGNTASIILPASAYSVTGPIAIAIKLTDGNAITTLAACVGIVTRSRTGVQIDPGQTVTDWTNQIAAALQEVIDTSAAQDVKINDLKSAVNSTDVQLGVVEGSILQTDDALGLKTSQATLTPSIGSTLYRPNNRLAILNPFYVRGSIQKVTVYANIGGTAGYTGKLYCGIVSPEIVHAGVAGVAPSVITTIAKQYKNVTAVNSSLVADQVVLEYDFSSDDVPASRIMYILLYVEPDNVSNVIYIRGLNYYANENDFPLDFIATSDDNPIFVTVAGTSTMTKVGNTSNNYMPIKLEIDGEIKAPDYPFVTELTGVRGTNVILDQAAKYVAPYNDADTLPIGTVITCSYTANGNMAHIPYSFRYGTIITVDYKNTETLGTQVQIAIERSGVVSIRHKFSSWREWQSAFENYGGLATFPSIGVVGDSFASGGIYITSGVIWNMYEDYSWPSIAERMFGFTLSNYSRAGASTRSWIANAEIGLPKLLSDDPSALYMLCLGTNDGGMYNEDSSYLGSLADITNTPDSNPDTFYGNYGRIIANIINHAPNAKLVLVIPWTYNKSSATYQTFITAYNEIANKFGIPVIDSMSDWYFNSVYFQNDGKSQNHPVAITYGGAAVAYNRLLGKCMLENVSYFFDTH